MNEICYNFALRNQEQHLKQRKEIINKLKTYTIMKKINLFAVAFVAVLSQSVNANTATQFGEIRDAVDRGSEIRTEYGRNIGAEYGRNIGTEIGAKRNIGAEYGRKIGEEYGRKIGAEYGRKIGAEYGRNIGTEIGAKRKIGTEIGAKCEIGAEYGRKIGAEIGSIRKIGAVERGSEIRTEYGRKIGTEYPKKKCAEYGRGTNRKIGTEVNIGRGMYV